MFFCVFFVYLNALEIYDNLPCDGWMNMNAMRNLSISNNFPPIGTFSLETALGTPQTSQPPQHHQQNHHQQHPPPPHHHQSQGPPPMSQHPPIGMFDANDVPEIIQNPATVGVFQSNSVLSNGGGSNFGQSNSSSSAANDPSQTTRETGIIEKLLVSN